MTEESTGQYANLGLQLGDQSGYELSLKEQVGQLQTLTTGNSVVSTSLSTAQSALSAIQSSAQTTLNNLAAWTPSRRFGRLASEHGPIGAAVVDQRGPTRHQAINMCSAESIPPSRRWRTIIRLPRRAAKTAIDQAFQTTFGVLPSDPAAANISASDDAELSFRAVRGAVPGRFVERGLVVGFERQHERRDCARSDRHNIDQRQSAGLSTAGPGLCDAERIRRIRAQRRCAAGRRHGRRLARFAGRQFDDQHSGGARLDARAPSPAPTAR